jgi:hypothetical protein
MRRRFPACEAIVALGEPSTYHAEGTDADTLVESFFRAASDVLPQGGMLIFDVIELGEPSLAGRYWRSGKNWAVLAETEEDRVHGRWSEISKHSGGLTSSTAVDAKFTEYGFSTLLHSRVNSLRAASQLRLHKPTARRSLLLVVALFSHSRALNLVPSVTAHVPGAFPVRRSYWGDGVRAQRNVPSALFSGSLLV